MGKLENFISQHREQFDDAEPGEGHLSSFLEKLGEENKTKPLFRNRTVLLKIAASVIVLITLSAIGYELTTRNISNQFLFSRQEASLSAELRDAMEYYNNETATKMATLSSLTQHDENIHNISQPVLAEISNLDAATSDLAEQLEQNPGNEQIEAAIVRNQQMKQSILNELISQISKQIQR
jgi:hypothetical protein